MFLIIAWSFSGRNRRKWDRGFCGRAFYAIMQSINRQKRRTGRAFKKKTLGPPRAGGL